MAIQLKRFISPGSEHMAPGVRLRSTFTGLGHVLGAARQHIAPPPVDSLEVMYDTELQELERLQVQACAIAEEIWVDMHDESLAQVVSAYAAQMRSRQPAMEHWLARLGPDTRGHADRAMEALAREASRTAQTHALNVRDAARAAALRRIIHHMIASYGTVAVHANALGRMEEAARFAECADEEQAADAQLSAVARGMLSPQA